MCTFQHYSTSLRPKQALFGPVSVHRLSYTEIVKGIFFIPRMTLWFKFIFILVILLASVHLIFSVFMHQKVFLTYTWLLNAQKHNFYPNVMTQRLNFWNTNFGGSFFKNRGRAIRLFFHKWRHFWSMESGGRFAPHPRFFNNQESRKARETHK